MKSVLISLAIALSLFSASVSATPLLPTSAVSEEIVDNRIAAYFTSPLPQGGLRVFACPSIVKPRCTGNNVPVCMSNTVLRFGTKVRYCCTRWSCSGGPAF